MFKFYAFAVSVVIATVWNIIAIYTDYGDVASHIWVATALILAVHNFEDW